MWINFKTMKKNQMGKIIKISKKLKEIKRSKQKVGLASEKEYQLKKLKFIQDFNLEITN